MNIKYFENKLNSIRNRYSRIKNSSEEIESDYGLHSPSLTNSKKTSHTDVVSSIVSKRIRIDSKLQEVEEEYNEFVEYTKTCISFIPDSTSQKYLSAILLNEPTLNTLFQEEQCSNIRYRKNFTKALTLFRNASYPDNISANEVDYYVKRLDG